MKIDLIKKLASKTDLLQESSDGQKYIDNIDGLENFAELIVKETTALLQQEWYDLNNDPKFEDGESPRDVGLRVGRKGELISMMAKINKHFGVK